MNSQDKPSVLIVAAEESSALYAARILENWNQRGLNIQSFGVGNQRMADLGFARIADSTEMAVVGLGEILKHWKKIRSTFHGIIERVEEGPPKFALLLDYPGFNLRLARELSNRGIKVIYYISPQLWAWKKNRIKKIKRYCDKMLVLFPFEEEFYKENGYSADYVGHQILDETEARHLDREQQLQERLRFGIQRHELLVGLMPGSRHSEIRLNLPTQLETARLLSKKRPNLKFALLLAPNLRREDLQISESEINLQIIQRPPFEMIGFCDALLCASGTATLMVGLIEKPMVIMYKMNSFSAWLARRLVQIKYFGLVNVIANREVVPERFQDEARPSELARLLEELIFDVEKRERAIAELREVKRKLGGGGATRRVVDILDSALV